MLKKFLGVVFLLLAALFLLLALQRVADARSIGFAVGSFMPTGLFTILGVFCLQKSPVQTPEQE